MNPRQLLIVLGIAVAGFGAAFLVSGSSGGGTEPVEAAKQPPAADVLEVAGAEVDAAAPASGALPKLKVPKPKTEDTSTSTTTTTTAPTTDTTDTTAPTTQTTTPTTQTTTPTTQTTPPATNNNDTGNGGFQQSGGED